MARTTTMTRKSLACSLLLGMACSIVIGAYEESLYPRTISSGNYHEAIQRLQSFKASLTTRDSIASAPPSLPPFSSPPAPAPAPSPLSLQVTQLCTHPFSL